MCIIELSNEKIHIQGGYIVGNTKNIYLRVTPEEKRTIEERMKLSGITNMNSYVQAMYGSIYNLREIGEVIRLLRYAGNNISQLAVKAHSGRWISMGEIDEIKQKVLEMEKTVMQIADQLRQMNGEL